MSRIIPSKPIVKVKRPLLFRRSQRLFGGTDAGTLLAEMRLKAFLRSMMPLRVWIGFLFVTSYASTLVSPTAAFALIIGFLIIGVSWLRMQWEQWYAEEFVAQFPWKGDSVITILAVAASSVHLVGLGRVQVGRVMGDCSCNGGMRIDLVGDKQK